MLTSTDSSAHIVDLTSTLLCLDILLQVHLFNILSRIPGISYRQPYNKDNNDSGCSENRRRVIALVHSCNLTAA